MNAFLEFAEQKMTRAHKRRFEKLVAKSKSEHDAPMVPSPMERAQQETTAQFRLYEKWRRERRDAVLSRMGHLKILLDNLTPADAQGFVAWFRKQDWSAFDRDMRHDILAVVDDAITKMRVQHGLPPIDDALWDEPPRVFQVIRKILTGVG